MKKLVATLFITLAMILVNTNAYSEYCTSQHYCSSGCDVWFSQDSEGWAFTVYCPGEDPAFSQGSGSYGGTLCGGQRPCSLPST